MAQKRMFSLAVVNTDRFLDMPPSAQALYFHLGLHADDDGFVAAPKLIMRSVSGCEDDLKLLIVKGYLIPFNSGVCVITDWKINNYIRSDRYTQTIYATERAQLSILESGAYCLGIPSGIPDTNQSVYPDKISIDKIRKDKKSNRADEPLQKNKRFTPPSVEEVEKYCKERKNNIDAAHFVDYYTACGWCVGKKRMQNWQAAVRTWEKNATPEKEKEKIDRFGKYE